MFAFEDKMFVLVIIFLLIIKLYIITKHLKSELPHLKNLVDIKVNYETQTYLKSDIYCTTNSDCVNVSNLNLVCSNYICSPSIEESSLTEIDCNSNLGEYSALSVNILGEFEYKCVETIPTLYSGGKLRPYVCGGKAENFEFDLNHQDIHKCDCKEKLLVTKEGDSLTPRCATEREKYLLSNIKNED